MANHILVERLKRLDSRVYKCQAKLALLVYYWAFVVAAAFAGHWLGWSLANWITWEILAYIAGVESALVLAVILVMNVKYFIVSRINRETRGLRSG